MHSIATEPYLRLLMTNNNYTKQSPSPPSLPPLPLPPLPTAIKTGPTYIPRLVKHAVELYLPVNNDDWANSVKSLYCYLSGNNHEWHCIKRYWTGRFHVDHSADWEIIQAIIQLKKDGEPYIHPLTGINHNDNAATSATAIQGGGVPQTKSDDNMTLASITKAFAELQETMQGLQDTIEVATNQGLRGTIGSNRAGGNNEDGSDEEIHKLYKDKILCMDDFKLQSFKTLGEGTFGKVYLCRGPGDREVALKVVSETNNLDKIKKEIRIHSLISPHIHITQIRGSFSDNGNMCLVLEYISGTVLTNLELSASTLAKYMYQLIIGLIHIHEHKVMHRDLKLNNIMIGSDGNLKIVDFGCAEMFPSKYTTYVGTDEYKAPEMLCRKKMHDHQVDTWAVGVLLYELLTCKLPFRGVNDKDVGWSEESKIIIWPKEGVLPAHARNLITNLLKEEPSDRISLCDVLKHPFMKYDVNSRGGDVVMPKTRQTM